MIRFFADKDIYAFDDFFLEKIMNREENIGLYDNMFNQKHKNISVFNKGVCGNGGTTGFIQYVLNSCDKGTGKGCLILVPNRSIVESKENKLNENKNISFVYGGVRNFDVEAQVVIATYDQYPKLMKRLKSAAVKTEGMEMKFWSGRTIIIDEYHKLITESGFRDVCIGITEMIRKTDCPVILMSATPYLEYIEMLQDLLPDREVVNYNVVYDYNVRSKITVYDIKEDRLFPVIKKMMNSSKNGHICVFYNCVEDIKNLAVQLGQDCEVLCSSARKDKLKELYSKEFNPDKKVHFLTSAFFTGCDLPSDVSEVIIVGSNEFDFMALDERDIKQILGRFRLEGGGVRYDHNSIFYLHKHTDPANYNQNKTDYDLKTIALNSPDFDWKKAEGGIAVKQSHIRLKKVLDTYAMWQSQDNLIRALSSYGFDTEVGDTTRINELEKEKKKKFIPFKKVKEMVKAGEPVTVFQYPDIDELLEYVKVFGTKDKLKTLTKVKLSNWYKVHLLTEGVELEGLSKQDLCDVFDLADHRIYTSKYLMECLEYFCDDCGYDNIPVKMEEYFGVTAVEMDFYNKQRYRNTYVLLFGGLCRFAQNSGPKLETLYTGKDKKNLENVQNGSDFKIPQKGLLPHIRFSYQTTITDHRTLASNKTMEYICHDGDMKSLKSDSDYKWMMEDKPNRLPVIKADQKRIDRLKMYGQSKLSEMYNDSTGEYRYTKSSVDRVGCLVCDIDGGLPFSEFEEMYKQWRWYALPTFSNVTEDWTKFRVIIPLKHIIYIGKGENNLRVLKCLRKLFCRWEDPQHGMYFQVNLEDYQNTHINEGELYDIPQDIVDNLHIYLDNCYEFRKERLDTKTVETKLSGFKINRKRSWDMDSAIKYCMENNKDGERHTALFVVKNNIRSEYLDEFGQWYLGYAGKRRYDKHWIGNSIIN